MNILMYHYVRPLEASRYPAIRGRTVEEFKTQLTYLEKRYHVCRPREVFECLAAGEAVPQDWVLLTFDDGYADHFRYVFPILDERNLSALFFPPVSVVRERSLLDVNKIQFTIAACASIETLCRRLIERLLEHGIAAAEVEVLKEKYFRPNRFDGPETIFVKRVLQKGVPLALRNRIASQLFAEFISVDESAFAEELYMSFAECRVMARAGMAFGSHGKSHYWMGELSDAEQEEEILASLTFLDEIYSGLGGVPAKVMCYPYGSYNAYTLGAMARHKFSFALTTQVGEADFFSNRPYELKRFDTNDFPVQ